MRIPRRNWWLMLATAATMCATLWITGCQSAKPPKETQASGSTQTQSSNLVERGKYLVTVGGCDDCHTPFKMGPNGPEKDRSRRLSGHPASEKVTPPSLGQVWNVAISATGTAFAGPWGVAFAANLTPDEETGIGIWDEQMFINAIRSGKHWGQGRPIAPIMPWHNYAQMSDDDLKAVLAFLKSLPPVKNEVPELIPPAGAKTQ